MLENNKPSIKELLDKHGEVRVSREFKLIKNDGRYFFSVNGCCVGISEQYLLDIIGRIPSNTVIDGWGENIG